MTGLDADLATLTEWGKDSPALRQIVKRVEAEVARLAQYGRDTFAQREAAEREAARLREENERLRGLLREWETSIATESLKWRVEAAERELARLQEGLRHIEAQPDSPGAADYMRAHARALLAEDGAA